MISSRAAKHVKNPSLFPHAHAAKCRGTCLHNLLHEPFLRFVLGADQLLLLCLQVLLILAHIPMVCTTREQ